MANRSTLKQNLRYEFWEGLYDHITFYDNDMFVLGVNPEVVTLRETIEILVRLGYTFPVGGTKAWMR